MSYRNKALEWQRKYPAVQDLKEKAAKRLPAVAWSYLQSGTGAEALIKRNVDDLQKVELIPRFMKGRLVPEIKTSIFGREYDAPFGAAPVGLTGLMWPKAENYLAASARRLNFPFTLSTVATETPETIGPLVGENGWFQLYPPKEAKLRKTLLDRAWSNGFKTLIVTADVPLPSRRERAKKAGLQIPPAIGPRFIRQALTHPAWTYATIKRGLPTLRTIEAYAEFKSMLALGAYVQNHFGGNLSWEYCKALRDQWKGTFVIKGLLHPADAEQAVDIGVDGVVVSNHGGRQFDAAPSAITALPAVVETVGHRTTILFDSGIRSGLDIMRALHLGADFVLCGRAFMYGVCALGKYGGDHVFHILSEDLKNNMAQLGIERLAGLGGISTNEVDG